MCSKGGGPKKTFDKIVLPPLVIFIPTPLNLLECFPTITSLHSAIIGGRMWRIVHFLNLVILGFQEQHIDSYLCKTVLNCVKMVTLKKFYRNMTQSPVFSIFSFLKR